MKIAVEGCCHGELDRIYETIAYLENREGITVDLLLCCGDFQAVRNEADLKCVAVPPKYRQMQTFYKYYSGEKKAPILTVFIGGNHEAANHLQELSYGGWVAPNIFYMGYAGVVRYGGLRIGGLSGIYKQHDYWKGHFESPPYNQNTLRSAYHVRSFDVFRLKQLRLPLDVFMSHDWPRGIYRYGRSEELVRRKRHFQNEVETNTLGSPAAAELLHHLRPTYWFSAHLHVKFAAFVEHKKKEGEDAVKTTRFLALDKCLPQREFLQVLDVPHSGEGPLQLEWDPEWLAILQATNHLVSASPEKQHVPENKSLHERWDYSVSEEEVRMLAESLGDGLRVAENFLPTVPAYDPQRPDNGREAAHSPNPQTTELCGRLGLVDPYAMVGAGGGDEGSPFSSTPKRPSTSWRQEDAAFSPDPPSEYSTDTSGLSSSSVNPDEIPLDDDDDDEDDEEDDDNEEEKEKEEDDCRARVHHGHSDGDGGGSRNPGEDGDNKDEAAAETKQQGTQGDVTPTTSPADSQTSSCKRTPEQAEAPTAAAAAAAEGASGVKKIKRRNQSIYTAGDEDADGKN
uniref:Lariat debranching enzyme B-like n=1 Tax=Petromyzon marinus TaxID=7757 RepID=A0AAJ7UA90_PETMA|nr:lariat debranching enzyme B-like [Petromyzon marinus]